MMAISTRIRHQVEHNILRKPTAKYHLVLIGERTVPFETVTHQSQILALRTDTDRFSLSFPAMNGIESAKSSRIFKPL